MAIPSHIVDGTGDKIRASVTNDASDKTNRLHVEARIATGSQVSVVPVAASTGIGSLYREFLADSGGSTDMIIDGATTPTDFVVNADPSDDIAISELRVTFTASSFGWTSAAFGKGGTALPNGVLIDIQRDGQAIELGEVHYNEEFLMLPARGTPMLNQSGTRDVLSLAIDTGGLLFLEHNSTDRVRVRIQDDLTGGTRDINYFRFAVFGTKAAPIT